MTQDRGDRLDRIEAALENLQQQLDNQVVVNAELRQSTTELRSTAEALLQVVTIHQQNFERLTSELNADRIEWRSQIERIWEHLQQRGNGRE
ncbi:MAG: hypothetical protein SAK29_29085 [Scytonema sp. PMC 1069.18]|nr:hypothetical protein [Scytonema sp. PMC 1069.18]MEC4888089.1 hypothetical protein [Scytonema sp. PMC 1070.18]